MKKANPILNATIPQKFMEVYHETFPEMADTTAYSDYVEAVFKYMILSLFGHKTGEMVINAFHFLYEKTEWSSGNRFIEYYHDKEHAMQVTIRTVLLLNHYGKIPNNCIAPLGQVDFIHDAKWYTTFITEVEEIEPFFKDTTNTSEIALVLASVFHDVGHSCGTSYDCFNVAKALVYLEPQLHFIVKRLGFSDHCYENLIRETVSYIQGTEWPYVGKHKSFYQFIIRAADLLSMLQHDWLQTCYYSLLNETIRLKDEVEYNETFLRHVNNQCGFISTIFGVLVILQKNGFKNLRSFVNGTGLVKCARPLFIFKNSTYWEKHDGPVNLLYLIVYRALLVRQTLCNKGVILPGNINPISVKHIVETYSEVYPHCSTENDFTFFNSNIDQAVIEEYNRLCLYFDSHVKDDEVV